MSVWRVVVVAVAVFFMSGVQANAGDRNDIELVRKLYDAIQNADQEKLSDVLDPHWRGDPLTGPGEGPGAYLPIAQNMQKALEGFRIEILDIIDAAPKYVVRTKMGGKHQANFLGVPPTGKDINFNTIDIHEVAGGKILRSWHIEDFATAMKQMK